METLEELKKAKAQQNASTISSDDNGASFKGILRSALGQGFMLGFGDETEAFIRSLGSDKEYAEIVKDIRQDIDKFRKDNPGVAITSEIAGAIIPSLAAGLFTGGTGTAAVLGSTAARAAAKVASVAPKTVKALKTAAPQAAVGGVYGTGVAEGDIGDRLKSGAVSGAISGTLGPLSQKVLPVVGQAARNLMQRGVQLTPGQATGNTVVGGALKNLEETLNLVPLVGTQKALDRSVTSFNKAVYDDIAKKINVKIPPSLVIDDIPNFIFNKTTQKLNNAAKGLEIKGAKEFNKQINKIISSESKGLTPAEQNILRRRLARLTSNSDDVIVGKSVQDIDRTLRQLGTSYGKSPDPSSKFILDAINDIDDLFVKSLTGKGNSVKNYKLAKSAYGDFMTTAKAGTASVNDSIFTPNQLLRASKAADKSVGKKQTFLNQGRMQDIGKQGQDILGRNINDSGTAIRNIGMNVASGAGMGGASYVGGPAVAIPTAAYLGALQTPQTTRALLELLNASSRGVGATVPMGSAYATQGLLQ
jgi:hypothetical protein